MPQVSVVVPVYKSAKTLEAAIGSILSQTHQDLEVVAVYDESDDDTLDILIKLAAHDNRLRVFRNPDADGMLRRMPAALNFGLANARGTFIARMDADDIALPDRIATQIEFLNQHPEVALCGMAMTLISQTGQRIRDLPAVCGTRRTRVLARYGPPLYHPTWMFRREILDVLHGYRDMYTEDYDFQLRALDAGFLLDNSPNIGVQYRINAAHRSSLLAHKSNRFAYRMHLRRLHGLDDGYSMEAARNAVAPSRWRALENCGQGLMQHGFALEERSRIIGRLLIAASLLILPSSATVTLRKMRTGLQLAFTR